MSKPELALISSVLRSRDHLTARAAGIEPKHFHTYRGEWEWVVDYISKHGKAPSKTAFRHRFPKTRILSVDDVGHYADEVFTSHAKFEVMRLAAEALEEVDSGDPMTGLRVMQQGSSKAAMEVELLGKNTDVVDDWTELYEEAKRRVEAAEAGGIPGIATGFSTLDARTGGPQPGHVWVVAARLGEGKSWAMLRMAAAALLDGKKVQFCSLEMSRSQVALRMHTFLSKAIHGKPFRNMDLMLGKNYSLKEYRQFLRTLRDNLEGKLFISDMSRGRVTAMSIAAIIENNRPDIIFIDYITLMGKGKDGWEGIEELSGDLKGLAERYGIPIVVAAQMNRAGVGQEPADPDKLAGSDAIGRDADAVVSLKQMSPHVAKMRLAKYRHGPDGYTWWNRFDVNNGLFEECDHETALTQMDADEDEKEL